MRRTVDSAMAIGYGKAWRLRARVTIKVTPRGSRTYERAFLGPRAFDYPGRRMMCACPPMYGRSASGTSIEPSPFW